MIASAGITGRSSSGYCGFLSNPPQIILHKHPGLQRHRLIQSRQTVELHHPMLDRRMIPLTNPHQPIVHH